jgi:hypothetical protein
LINPIRIQIDEITTLQSLNKKKAKLVVLLEELDKRWTQYEKCYVFELMVIETDARRFIVAAIKID